MPKHTANSIKRFIGPDGKATKYSVYQGRHGPFDVLVELRVTASGVKEFGDVVARRRWVRPIYRLLVKLGWMHIQSNRAPLKMNLSNPIFGY